ncbi:hypothetical protein V3W47_04930 [Deinococcus sp. YIM 134068]|uniref:hypothetical protein n=1 Tax=Deinococcus lichenicola TaxID=3118910 RepID=UPI002F937B46
MSVQRQGNTVEISVFTTPPPQTCTTESGHMEPMSIRLPPNTFARAGEPVTIFLNGKEIGTVNTP